MGLFDKLSNLIYEDDPNDENTSKAKGQKAGKKGSWTDIFFEDTSEKPQEPEKKKKSFMDIFFEEEPEEETDDGIKSTFVRGEDTTSVLTDIASQIESRESELINLAEFFKTVNPKDYPDSAAEYEAYLSLVKQLNSIKDLSSVGKNSSVSSINNYQLESAFRKFELDYQTHINAIQSLCYLSEISTINTELQSIFSSNFTNRTESKIAQTEGYITLISRKSNKFDKKYSSRLYKELIEAEYRLTILKLMNELRNGRTPRKNPFASFSSQKKKTFQTYISKDLRDTNNKYNSIADSKEKYVKYGHVNEDFFLHLDTDAEIISERINKYTIDDFLLNELFENGDGFETLKRFLSFKLNLNFVDSKTTEVDARYLDDNYRRVTEGRNSTSTSKRVTPTTVTSKKGRKFPNYDDDL